MSQKLIDRIPAMLAVGVVCGTFFMLGFLIPKGADAETSPAAVSDQKQSVLAYNLIFGKSPSLDRLPSIQRWAALMFMESGGFGEIGDPHSELFRVVLKNEVPRTEFEEFVRSFLADVSEIEGPESQINTVLFDAERRPLFLFPGRSHALLYRDASGGLDRGRLIKDLSHYVYD